MMYGTGWNKIQIIPALNNMVKSESVGHSVLLDSATLGTVACKTPLPMGFSRQEYWSGLSFPSPGIFLIQGSNLHLLWLLRWQVDSLPLSHLGSPIYSHGMW